MAARHRSDRSHRARGHAACGRCRGQRDLHAGRAARGPASKGAPGWTRNGAGTKWTFKDRFGTTAGGIIKVVVSDRSAKTARLHTFTVSDKAANFQIAAGAAPVGMQVFLGDAAGQCAVKQFNPDVGPPPSCRLAGGSATLSCK